MPGFGADGVLEKSRADAVAQAGGVRTRIEYARGVAMRLGVRNHLARGILSGGSSDVRRRSVDRDRSHPNWSDCASMGTLSSGKSHYTMIQ